MKTCFVIDTNVWVMALPTRSPYHKILQKLMQGKFRLAVSQEILLEYEEIVAKKLSPTTATIFLKLLNNLPDVELVQTFFQWNLIPDDPDDNKFVDVAIAAGASLLVSQDRHFRVLRKIPFPKITVAEVDDFLVLLDSEAFK